MITGKPYSAEQVTDRVQTLADGTHITQVLQKTLMYRDSEGRTRTDQFLTLPAGSPEPSFIQINDPVAGVRYTLNPRNHTAQRVTYNPAVPTGSLVAIVGGVTASGTVTSTKVPSSGAVYSVPKPEFKREPLGTQSIDGITAQGSRLTMTYPEGSIGNDRLVTVVTETWTSTDLRLVVLSKTSDPRNGDSTTKLENLSRTEPDPTLFQVPVDYTLTDMPQPTVPNGANK